MHTVVERAHTSEITFQICFQTLLAHSLTSNEIDIDYARSLGSCRVSPRQTMTKTHVMTKKT